MLSAEEGIARATALAEKAARDEALSPTFLELAEEWLRLSEMAQWQDLFFEVEHTPGRPKDGLSSGL